MVASVHETVRRRDATGLSTATAIRAIVLAAAAATTAATTAPVSTAATTAAVSVAHRRIRRPHASRRSSRFVTRSIRPNRVPEARGLCHGAHPKPARGRWNGPLLGAVLGGVLGALLGAVLGELGRLGGRTPLLCLGLDLHLLLKQRPRRPASRRRGCCGRRRGRRRHSRVLVPC
jgi:hypothetical protein